MKRVDVSFQGELKLLHEENDMLREQVCTLANHQTNGEVSENSSTESSERLESLYKLYRPKHGESWKKKFFYRTLHVTWQIMQINCKYRCLLVLEKKFIFCSALVESIHHDNTVSSDKNLETLFNIYPHRFPLTFRMSFEPYVCKCEIRNKS